MAMRTLKPKRGGKLVVFPSRLSPYVMFDVQGAEPEPTLTGVTLTTREAYRLASLLMAAADKVEKRGKR